MKSFILNTLSYSKNLIISPDIDGFISARLLMDLDPEYKIVGTYDKNVLLMASGYKFSDCLFVDCDMNRQNLVSIGNHQRLSSGDFMSTESFNPNVHYNVSAYNQKYPFATAFLIAYASEKTTSLQTQQLMLYADSTHKNMEKYSENMNNWRVRMECPEIARVFEPTPEDLAKLEDFQIQYPTQGFVSKRLGKKRYIEQMNRAIADWGLNSDILELGVKYASDKVGKTTLQKFNKHIISYAEVFTGEYSVTYDQEIEWR